MEQNIIFRLERPEDERKVEELVRDSFWNVYQPGCSEHYLLHCLRPDPLFIPELNIVMELNGRIIGQNVFVRAIIRADDGREIPILTMGPICIANDLKRKGYGNMLLVESFKRASAMGFGAVCFEGNHAFYSTGGCRYGREFGLRYHDLPEGADDSFFLCRELIPGYLDGITGVYETPKPYYVDDAQVEAYDRQFAPKVKLKLPGQLF